MNQSDTGTARFQAAGQPTDAAGPTDRAERISVLFLIGRGPLHPRAGGGDLQAWEWARYLVAQGHRVTFVSMSSSKDAEALRNSQGVTLVHLRGGIGLPMRAWRWYRRHRSEFDVIYEDPIGADRPPFFSPLYASVPVVGVWHQLNSAMVAEGRSRPIRLALLCLEKALSWPYRRSLIRVPSQQSADEVGAMLPLPAGNLRVIHASVPDSVYAPVETSEDEFARRRILFLGNIRRYKGVHWLIQAFAMIYPHFPDIDLVIAGRRIDRHYEQELRDLAAQLLPADRYCFALDVADAEKMKLIAQSWVLVLPSVKEGFGLVVIEANAQGKPVIVSEGIPPTAVVSGFNGIRVPIGNIRALAKELEALLSDRARYTVLSSGAVGAASQYSWRTVGQRFHELLCEAVANGPQGSGRTGQAGPRPA